ncbi:MAG TPA: endonuclease [Bacteroidales bacterium]|nr:endonuclease [Bacteroidales bacterium]HRZ49769.1 endonuclease [Bacteroidales bacterium]
MKRFLLFFLMFSPGVLFAQIPAGYYDAAAGLQGDTLRQVLHQIIRNHSQQTYSSLWIHFQKTDKKSTGEVWDIYSDIPGGTPAYTYQFVTNQCGSYSQEGDCYNREHTVPSSWFNDAYPMYSDIFHLYPTDGFVNGKRSNYPYGTVNAPTWTSTNGSKLGPSASPGYTGTVFEPIGSYKGDLARTYFYMLVRYLDVMQGWSSPMFAGDSLTTWARNMLLQWHYQDTVSQKEINRNDSVYAIQGNRNPFIDHPEWVAAIWDHSGIGLNSLPVVPSFTVSTWPDKVLIHNPAGELLTIKLTGLTGTTIFQVTSPDKEITLSPIRDKGVHILLVNSPRASLARKIFTP